MLLQKIDYAKIESEKDIEKIYEVLLESTKQNFDELCVYHDKSGRFEACYS